MDVSAFCSKLTRDVEIRRTHLSQRLFLARQRCSPYHLMGPSRNPLTPTPGFALTGTTPFFSGRGFRFALPCFNRLGIRNCTVISIMRPRCQIMNQEYSRDYLEPPSSSVKFMYG